MNWSLNYGTANLIVPASTIGAGMVTVFVTRHVLGL